MESAQGLSRVIANLLQSGDLTFRDFVEVALYHPELGYYSRPVSPVGKGGDYVTSPTLSPVFAFALGNLIRELIGRNEGAVSSIVDIGCGDGSLLDALSVELGPAADSIRWFGVDRSLARVGDRALSNRHLRFVTSIDEVPRDGAQLFLSNELFDALPFARLVMRDEHLHELWVSATDEESFAWKEYEAPAPYEYYFHERGIELADGQFADLSLEWEAFYGDLAARLERGLLVTFDYGYPGAQLFHSRVRRFGTAAAYSQQRVTRDLLANPGQQDLTAHINFTDLERAGERHGLQTLFFERQAKFLLSIGITAHPLFTPVHEVAIESAAEGLELIEAREEARRLVLPDSIGHDIRVLVQGKGVELEGWSFQRKLF
jgi:SAM-dependent MidA family methyltransferase